jgi:hypothetical protein
MARWLCTDCGCLYAAGAPCCPQCRATAHEEEDGVEKLTGSPAGHPPEDRVTGAPAAGAEEPPESSPASSAPAEPAPEPVPAPVPEPAPKKASPAGITGSGGVTLPKPGAAGGK